MKFFQFASMSQIVTHIFIITTFLNFSFDNRKQIKIFFEKPRNV